MSSGVFNLSPGIKAMKDYQRITQEKGLEVAKKFMLEVVRKTIAPHTPVITGRLAGGWLLSFNSIDRGQDAFGVQASLTKNEIRYQNAPKSISKIFVTNNVKYAPFIEFGTPKMPPQKPLALGLISATSRLKEITARVKSGT